MSMSRRPVIIHGDGTVTCWRTSAREHQRTPYAQVSMEDVRAMGRFGLELFARAYPRIRAALTERTLARVRMGFVLELPLGETIPSPTLEAIDAAALAIAGPVSIAPGSRISVERASSSASSLSIAFPRAPAKRSARATRGSMHRSLDQSYIQVSCSTGHPLSIADPVGYMSLKEAGAGLTVLAYRCRACFRSLYVTEEPPVARAAGVDTSAQDDVE